MARQIAEALGSRTRQGHHPPRPQASERQDHARWPREGAGLRPAQRLQPARPHRPISQLHRLLAATHDGLVLGTAAYMSPQQARGQLLDKRTDIWSFGCVLYEMLSGRRAFDRQYRRPMRSPRFIEREPDWTALPPTTPQSIRTLIERCLEKDLKLRLRDIGDARLEINRAAAKPSTRASAERSADRRPRAMPWALGGALALVAVLAVAVLWPPRAVPSRSQIRVSV